MNFLKFSAHRRTGRRQKGQGLVEYALILVLVAVVVIVSMLAVGKRVAGIFCTVAVQIGGDLPANVATMCNSPQIALNGISDGQTTTSPLTVEAVVTDPKTGGVITNAQNVKFYIDNALVQTELTYKYCLGAGDGSCAPLNVSHGAHTMKVVALDSKGNSGSTTISFTISN